MSAVLLSLLSVVAVASPAAAAAPGAADIVRLVLPSGTRVVVLRDRSAPLVAARAVWSGGTRRETDELAGLSAVLAGAWTGGCGRLDTGALADELAADGASMTGFAGRDTVGLGAEWSRAGWERGFDLLADCASSPRFDPLAVEGARTRALEAAARRAADPAWAALDLVERELAGAATPTAPPVFEAGPTALERVDARALRQHHRERYPIAAMTLVVVGDIDPGRVMARARARFGSAPRVRPPDRPAAPTAPPARREVYRRLDRGGVAVIALAYPAVGRSHRDRAALEVAAELIGGARAALLADADRGSIVLHRACRPDDVTAALAALRAAVDRLRGPGPDEAEVRRAAGRLARARRAALAHAPQAAALLALYELLGPGAEHAARHAASLDAVRAADVAAAARRYLRPEVSVIATASPLLASPEAARRLRGVVRRSSSNRARPVRARPHKRQRARHR
ncbi:MAG TPA: insulinase family protein [Kofleriaceae bacterium]|nr:insulinase family protein [Kofleriaceae bacterium]